MADPTTPIEADAGEAKTETWREVFGARVWVNDRGDMRVHAEINPPPIKPKPAPPKEDPTP